MDLQSTTLNCPYCGEPQEIEYEIPASALHYTEDCQICCQPMVIVLRRQGDGVDLEVRRENG